MHFLMFMVKSKEALSPTEPFGQRSDPRAQSFREGREKGDDVN